MLMILYAFTTSEKPNGYYKEKIFILAIMVKTTITPEQANIHLTIPEHYIGKTIEVLVYSIEELQEDLKVKDSTRKKASDYKGTLPSELVEKYQEHIKISREGWNAR